ncbi:hypothetical protein B0O80DRAFT_451487 [Mortierella sp. GBAus27b]|nr:hypothetical protein B0O80DRAFT_451487 [Mortierella sp. GBAus27b]
MLPEDICRTRTMAEISTNAPGAHGADSLQEYRQHLSRFYDARAEAASKGIPFIDTPPKLPSGDIPDNGRYALSNYLVTNGLQAHLRAYDVKKPRSSTKSPVGIQDIKRRLPDREAITRTLGSKIEDCAVIGVDPGERVSASFCGLHPHKHNQVTNLGVKCAALYSPTLRHRRAMDKLKNQNPSISRDDITQRHGLNKRWKMGMVRQ